MKTWIHRTPAVSLSENDIQLVRRHPETAINYTKLYVLYDRPDCNRPQASIDDCRKVEIPNYWYPDIEPGKTVEFNS